MPPVEVGPTRAVMALHAAQERKAAGEGRAAAVPDAGKALAVGASVETSAALDPGAPPVDADRVAAIRRAIETGSYPLIPTRIADAMIATAMILRSPRA